VGETLAKDRLAMSQPFFGKQYFPSKLLPVQTTNILEFDALEQIGTDEVVFFTWSTDIEPSATFSHSWEEEKVAEGSRLTDLRGKNEAFPFGALVRRETRRAGRSDGYEMGPGSSAGGSYTGSN
jgi:hypothetical protein